MKVFLKWAFAFIMMLAGINHFINPAFYQAFIPDWMPLLLVNYVIGFVEFVIGLGLLLPKFNSKAATLLFLLMIFFLPFHVIDAFREHPAIGSHLLAYIRLPIQFLLIWWAWFLTRRNF
ncbi:DoxX family protein [Pedobacter sp. PWIIR3]